MLLLVGLFCNRGVPTNGILLNHGHSNHTFDSWFFRPDFLPAPMVRYTTQQATCGASGGIVFLGGNARWDSTPCSRVLASTVFLIFLGKFYRLENMAMIALEMTGISLLIGHVQIDLGTNIRIN